MKNATTTLVSDVVLCVNWYTNLPLDLGKPLPGICPQKWSGTDIKMQGTRLCLTALSYISKDKNQTQQQRNKTQMTFNQAHRLTRDPHNKELWIIEISLLYAQVRMIRAWRHRKECETLQMVFDPYLRKDTDCGIKMTFVGLKFLFR